ncbi:MAG: glycosyltransferase, partial [Vicinamibacterales bacterium]
YGCLAAKLARVPRLVHSEHGRTFSDRKVRFVAQRWMSRFAHSIFAVSEQLKGDLVRHVGISPSRIDVLHNGVDLTRFAASIPSAAARQELGIGTEAVVVGSVGRLVAVKNYELLLRAAAATRLPGLQVVLIGDGPERAKLIALSEHLGIGRRVHFLGHREDVSRLLGTFDIFVLPSLSEGMSNTLLEAMAHGVAPLVSDVGGNTEIVRHGATGLVFESGNEAMLADQIRRLGADEAERRRLGRAALARVSESFALDGMIKRYEDLYARVALGTVRC